MLRFKALLIAAPVAIGLLAAPAAHAEWRGEHGGWHGGDGYERGHRGDWHGGGYERGHRDGGPGIAGVVIGLGAAALLGGVIASQAYGPPPVYYAPPPPVYYAPPPVYYAPPPVYYAPAPAYYPRAYYPRGY